MRKMDIVILHYNNIETTRAYLGILEQMNWENISCHFIVVDNGSPDGSGKLLMEEYQGNPQIVILLKKENLGFARGNNVGIRFSIDNFHSELIIISNNDIVIEDNDFFQKLNSLYEKECFAVCGPDIFSLDKQIHQSPVRERMMTVGEIENEINGINKKLRILRYLRKFHLYEVIRYIKRIIIKKCRTERCNYQSNLYNVVLHGAFFIISGVYLNEYPDGLYDGTFMYKEEDILTYRCNQKDLKIIYTPNLKVLHYDGASTLKSSGNRVNKYIFELEHTKDSAYKLLEMMVINYKYGD